MSERQGCRGLIEWAAAFLIAGAVAVGLMVAVGRSPFKSAAGPPPALRTIELFAQADPLDAGDAAEVHVADVTVDGAGSASLARCSDEKVSAQLEAALADMRRRSALPLAVEERHDEGLALGETDVPPSDPRYVWAAGRFLRLKTGLSYQVSDPARD